jgi:type IV secretory pathway VirB2 component (pilin)
MPSLLVLMDLGATLTTLYDKLVRPLDIPIAIIVVAIGGYYWMTGHVSDDARKVGRGREIIIGAIVGALIVWFAPDIGASIQQALPQ